MEFKFKQIYLLEGFKPVCLQIATYYAIQNDAQRYLWPVVILAKGELTNCDKESEENFLPFNNLGFFITAGVATFIVCLIGCLFHFIRLLAFLKVGMVSL